MTDLIKPVLPLLILIITALVVLVIESFAKEEDDRSLSFSVSVIGIGITLYSLFSQLFSLNQASEKIFFGGSIILDHWGLGFSIIATISALLVVLSAHNYLSRIQSNLGEFYTLVLFATIGMITMAIANDMMTFFIALEVMSIAIYVLAGLNIFNPKSNESAMKYFILGVFSTAFLILGIAFIYGATGEMAYSQIGAKLSQTQGSDFYMGFLGLVLILVGFLFKIGAFPFQQWVPDVYEGSPTVVTAFMATGVKAAAFAVMVRILFVSFPAELYSDKWVDILSVVAILTMVLGNIVALVQTNIKRLLAYSGIAHTGYILLALIAAKVSPNGTEGHSAVIFYLLTYTFMTVGAFVVLIAAGHKGKDLETLEDIRGFAYKNKFLGAAMAIFFFSMAGIPSTAGFMGKFFIFKSAISAELYTLAIVGIVTAIVSVYFYLKVAVFLYLKEESRDYPVHHSAWNFNVVTVITLIATIVLGLFPHIGFLLLKIS